MKRAVTTTLTLLVVLLLGVNQAAAAVCVEIDAERDSLTDNERKSVRIIIEDELAEADMQVDASDCSATYTAYNVRLGDKIRATLKGPNGKRTLEAHTIEELPETYDQLVRALVEDLPVEEVTDRQNVTSGQQHRERLYSETLFYARLGYGMVTGGDFASGPAFGIGIRHELNHVALDFSALNLIVATNSETGGVNGNWLRIGADYLFNGTAPSTPFIGGGVSWGGTHIQKDGVNYGATGVHAEISGGYEMLRTADIRLFVKGNAILPLYTVDSGDSELYSPSFTVSLGAGI